LRGFPEHYPNPSPAPPAGGRGISTKKDYAHGQAADILKRIKDEEIEWVDLRFTDPKGKWQHLTMVAGVIGEDELKTA
jgi:hypothetical protein